MQLIGLGQGNITENVLSDGENLQDNNAVKELN